MHSFLFLAQTDTTAGFLSRSMQKINDAKGRKDQKVLIQVDSLLTLQRFARVPQKHKNQVRRAQKTTFIYPNGKAIRVIKDPMHLRFLSPFQWLYSSSANATGKTYDPSLASSLADAVVTDARGLYEAPASQIIRLNNTGQRRIRK